MIKIRTHLVVIIAGTSLLGACGAGDGSTPLSTQEPAINAALPATEVNNAAADGPMSPNDAFRFLQQSTFGPTMDSIENTSRSGANSWINEQMQLPTQFLSDGLRNANNTRWNEYINVWLRHGLQAEDQLRQRVAFALSQIFVVSADDGLGDEQFGLANYYDILLRHSFGNYRDLLEEITLNPIMGEYLSMKGNRKPEPEQNIQPDENYAREVLQLFSIGQVMLNSDGSTMRDDEGDAIPAYDQSTIENFARVFTGWHFANAEHYQWPKNSDYISAMVAWEEYHDTDSKTLLLGETAPGGLNAQADLDLALDNIFNHPNVAPFISKQLIQRLITSNPSAQYVSDVAAVFNRNQAGERGSLASTVKAILMHSEARYGHLQDPDTFGKLKEPLLRLTQLWRAFSPSSIPNDFAYSWVESDLGQAPLSSPSVFNFFRPEYSQPGDISDAGLVSPEFQILDETSIIKTTTQLLASSIWSHNYKNESSGSRIAIDITDEMSLEPDPDELLDHLNLLLMGGRMSQEMRTEILWMMDQRNYANAASQRVVEAIFLIVTSPDAAIQR